jgi:hypothetical protein
MWGLDILGPFTRAVEGYRYLYVTIDKFTKWPEASPVVKIKKQSTIKLVTHEVVTGRPSHMAGRPWGPASTNFWLQICCYRLLESFTVKPTHERL